MREGQSVTIPSSNVVPGDLMILEAGSLVPADGRLLEVYGLTVNESSLYRRIAQRRKTYRVSENGRRAAVSRRSGQYGIFRFSGYLRAGCRSSYSHRNEYGDRFDRFFDEPGRGTENTPADQPGSFFRSSGAWHYGNLCFGFGLSVYRKEPVLDALMFAVALAVAAIPEALSSIVTIVQAMGTQKMAREHAIIKDLKAVESLWLRICDLL